MSTTSTDPNNKSAAQIEGEVEQTRASVSGTLDALRGKLEPRQMLDQMVEQVADYARGSGGADFARNLGAAVRDNPLPVVLIGAGIGWLLLSKSGAGTETGSSMAPRTNDGGSGIAKALTYGREQISGAVSATRESVGNVKEAVSDAASGASAHVSNVVSRAGEAGSSVAGNISEAASEGVRRARALGDHAYSAATSVGDGLDVARDRVSSTARGTADRFSALVEAQPLMLGVLGMALGAAVGAALPRTRTEDRVLGGARDAAVDRLSAVVSESYEDIKGAAGEQIEQVKGAVSETYEKTKDHLDQGGISATGSALGNAAGDVAQAVGGAVSNIAAHVARKVDEAGPERERPENDGASSPHAPATASR